MPGFQPNELRRASLNIVLFSAFLLWAGSAAAQQAIGGAKVIENDVRGTERGTALVPVHIGDQVFQDESVRTAAASLAQLVLRDETNVSLGPSSAVKLDRFVYSDSGGTARQVALTATKGTFRFFSGDSAHSAYQVTTPQATIGVRGTVYDVQIVSGNTRVVLQEGALHVCVLRNTRNCVDLTEPGSSVVVTSRGISGPVPPAQKSWDFGSLCGRAQLLCNRTTIAGLDLSIGRTRTQLAGLPGREPPRRAAPKGKKRPVRYQEGGPVYGGDDGGEVPTVVTMPPVVPIIPLFGGFRGGFGRGGGGRGGDRDQPLR